LSRTYCRPKGQFIFDIWSRYLIPMHTKLHDPTTEATATRGGCLVVFHFGGVQVVFSAGNWGSCVFFLCGELGEVRHHDDFIGCVLVYA
jgi:hypothetical protein